MISLFYFILGKIINFDSMIVNYFHLIFFEEDILYAAAEKLNALP